MDNKLKIREFNNSDLDQVLYLHKKAMEEINAFKGDGPWDNDLKNIEKHYKDNNGMFLVGLINNKIVTMGAIRKIDSNIAEIKRMRTFPENQGNGYGKRILNELIKIAKELNYSEIILETSDKQFYAKKLYTNSGFKEYKKEIIDGYNCTWFKLDLT
jgi:GNAT superfamily N-acetyltransferase